ncbi:MAG: hypothetical protein PF904_15465 [Kiritimatiellae bacterium]|nr:hypothetical protein [Kiritimatiellia bacterium]
MSVRLVVVMSGFIVLLGAGNASAGTIAFDPFPVGDGAYTNDFDFKDQGPTNAPIFGYTGVWTGTEYAESSSTVIDAPVVIESGGSYKFAGMGADTKRSLSREFTELPCSHGDTNYWSMIVMLTSADADGSAYVTWRDTDIATFMAIDLGIMEGHLTARLREDDNATFNLGSVTPGKAYHLVAKTVITGAATESNHSAEDATFWVNPTLNDILNANNAVTNYSDISFISPGYDHNRTVITTAGLANRTAYIDEVLYTTDVNDLNLSIQKIQSATFNPMPRPDNSGSFANYISHDFEIDSVILGNGRYTNIEGPTNAWVAAEGVRYPANGDSVTADESLIGLNINFPVNISTAEVMFASTVTSSSPGGFFLLEFNGDDYDFVIRPLDELRNPIGNWSLIISNSTAWSANLTGEKNVAFDIQFNSGTIGTINGLAFNLGDFTGGSGVLTDVCGLQFVDSSPSFDPVMVGIYQGPTEELSIGSTAQLVTAARFNRVFIDNPITNDFKITGISTAERDWNSVEGSAAANIYMAGTSYLVYPLNGTPPANKEAALEGLAVNGVLITGSSIELMFASPVENPGDRIFIIEDNTLDSDPITVRPLDADRFPISTHSLYISSSDWGGFLTPHSISYNHWGMTDTGRQIGGVAFGISDFAGGTNVIEQIWGIRIEDPYDEIDLIMVGRTRDEGTLILIH